MKNTKLNIMLILIGLFIIVGVSYAYFSAKIFGNESTSTISYEAGYLEIELNGGGAIIANKIMPGDSPFITKNITLTGNNDSNGNMPYNIEIVVDNNTYTTDSISYSIEGTNTSNSGVLIPNMEYIPINDTTIIGSGFFERGSNLIHTYTIKFYFLETNTDQSANMRANFSAHIIINGEEAEKPAPKGWWKADSATLLGAIRDNSVVHQDTDEGMTTPGKDTATTDEQLRMALDDYGVSYYFRGAVTNNYVVFANKCWKIVRVTGNGAIKLFYWGDITNNRCGDVDKSLIAQFNNNDIQKSPAGIGFMYGSIIDNPIGNTNEEKYLIVHSNINDSNILTSLKSWYKMNIIDKGYNNYLEDVIWCGDKSLVSLTPGEGWQANSRSDFGAYKRISIDKSPSLICPEIKTNSRLSKYTAEEVNNQNGNGLLRVKKENDMYDYYKVGLITIDEASFAGGKWGSENKQYYMYNGMNNWTMSPSYYSNNMAFMWCLYSTGNLVNHYAGNGGAFIPSIALIPTLEATYTKNSEYAPGTAGNPYIVTVPNENQGQS